MAWHYAARHYAARWTLRAEPCRASCLTGGPGTTLWPFFRAGPARRRKQPDWLAPGLALQRIEEGAGAQGIGRRGQGGGIARHRGRRGSDVAGRLRGHRGGAAHRRSSPPAEPPQTGEEAAQHLGHCGEEMGRRLHHRRGGMPAGRRRSHRLARPELQLWAPVRIEIRR
jgi:hypothetical protein